MTMLFRGRFKVFLPCSRNFLHKFTLQCRVCFDFADDSSSKTFNRTFRILKVLKLYKGQGFGPTFVVSNSQLLDILNSEKRRTTVRWRMSQEICTTALACFSWLSIEYF